VDSCSIPGVSEPEQGYQPQSRVRRVDTVWSRGVLDETVLLDGARELYFGVNPTGSLLWSAMKDVVTLESLAKLIVASFAVPDEQARADVAGFVSELDRHGLVEILPPRDRATTRDGTGSG